MGITHLTQNPLYGILIIEDKMATKKNFIGSRLGRVRPDGRKRVALGKVAKLFEDYEAYEAPDGRVTLIPMVTVPASEAWLHRNESAMESVQRGLKQSAQGKTVRKPSLAKHANDEIE